MDDSSSYHPIACESCRNRKSKCDRDLPICSQCALTGAECRYPPTNKRGLPSGYVALVEQRLLESELVIFELLSTLYNDNLAGTKDIPSSQDREILADFTKTQSKLKKVDEWKNFPLATDEERHAWWMRKRDIIGYSKTDGSTPGNHDNRSDVLQDASPASTCLTPNTHSEAPLPPIPPPQESVTDLNGWQHDMGDVSNIGFNALVRDGGPSNNFQSAPVAMVGNLTEQPSPSLRVPNNDRWRKYF